ncbi:MAG TPA: hypothetical protein VF412_01535 [Bdellovibrio sp.]|uniref:hypothetical protein n=1 Tax=Bdellovibrio sp. TaxID=28201 RepID=UPI002EE75CCF
MRYLILLLLAVTIHAHAGSSQTFKLAFKNTGGLDLQYETYDLPLIFKDKVGTNGSITDIRQLTPIKKLKNDELTLGENETKLIGLVVRSKSHKAYDFFVAPHSTNQPQATLDFKFNCLCYHHVYHLEKGKMWYRVMELQNTVLAKAGKTIVLSHEFIPWDGTKDKEPQDSSESEHHH